MVDKANRRIGRSGQREEIQEITPGPGHTLHCKTKLTLFDQNGNRIDSKTGSWDEQLIKPFQSMDSYQGRNYFQDFCEYLQSTGQADAIPSRGPYGGAPQQLPR